MIASYQDAWQYVASRKHLNNTVNHIYAIS